MSQAISLFSGYSQKENRTTNYCLLVLKMLYEENPKFLSEVLSSLVEETLGSYVGVTFLQQQRQQSSIPDGLIRQLPFTVYIETKNHDWFYDAQLEAHLEALSNESPGVKVLLALANFENLEISRFDHVRRLVRDKYPDEVYFTAASFEDFLQAVQSPPSPKNLSDAIVDFGAYLDGQGLLPSWRNTLDVINCATMPDDILKHHVYMCPAQGGPYNHRRCQYFGMYGQKRVQRVALIRAVVDLEDETNCTLLWRNVEEPIDNLITSARQSHKAGRPGKFPTRVFVLGDLYPTDFRKDTPKGMQGSKQYFDVAPLGAKDAMELATALNGLSWTGLKLKDLNI